MNVPVCFSGNQFKIFPDETGHVKDIAFVVYQHTGRGKALKQQLIGKGPDAFNGCWHDLLFCCCCFFRVKGAWKINESGLPGCNRAFEYLVPAIKFFKPFVIVNHCFSIAKH